MFQVVDSECWVGVWGLGLGLRVQAYWGVRSWVSLDSAARPRAQGVELA